MEIKEVKALVIRFEKANGRFKRKQNIGVHIYLDPVEGKIIILTSDDDLRQGIRAKIAKLKKLSENDIKEIQKEGAPKENSILRKIKNALLNKKRKGVIAKEAEYLLNFHRITPIV